VSHALTHSSVSIARAIIKPTQTTVCSGNTASTRSYIQKNMLISKKPGRTQFVQLGMPTTYDFERPQDFFTKHLKKQFYYQHNP